MYQAFEDVIKGAKNYEFWLVFGANDVRSKYRRSILGHWWTTITVYLFILIVGTLYQQILSVKIDAYLVYFGVGYIIWIFISESLISGCQVLISNKSFILQRERPVSIFVFRLVYREILLSVHNILLLPLIFLWLGILPSLADIGISLIGILICIATVFFVVMFFSIISLRFRDIVPLMKSIMRLAFFVTPVVWINRDLTGLGYWINLLNPFQYFLEIIRNPILSQPVHSSTWIITGVLLIFSSIISLVTLSLTKKNIPNWL